MKILFATLLLSTAVLAHPWAPSEVEIEAKCTSLKNVKRGSKNKETREFDKLGCCYNDGEQESPTCLYGDEYRYKQFGRLE